MSFNYDNIQRAIINAITAFEADLDMLVQVSASEEIIFETERDIASLDEAAEIVARYQDLET